MTRSIARLLLQPSINNMAKQIIHQKNIFSQNKKFNLIIEGIGFGIYYAIGAISLILEITRNVNCIHLNNIYGASSGALAGLLYILAEHNYLTIDEIYSSYDHFKFPGLASSLKKWLNKLLPDNIFELVNKRLNIFIFNLTNMKKCLISNFNSKNEVIDAVIGSCSIPGITCSKYYIPNINKDYKWIDPIFCGNVDDTQSLIIKINPIYAIVRHLYPPWRLLIPSNNSNIDILCIYGMKDCYKSLILNSKIKSIQLFKNKFSFSNSIITFFQRAKILMILLVLRYLYKKNIYRYLNSNLKHQLQLLTSLLNNLINQE